MAKKTVVVGAPMYMAQYTALMTILLAFFILLNTLTEDQDAGFNAGIGDVQNAFGHKGGLGIFKFSYAGKGAQNPIALEKPKDKDSDVGFDKNMTTSGGGPGNTDADFKDQPSGKYLRVRINYDFRKNSAVITPEMREYLKKIGMGFDLFNYKIWIRCYCTESKDELKDAKLANRRAVRIMRFLNRYCQIPYDRMVASGSGSIVYFDPDIAKKTLNEIEAKYEKEPQGAYFYVYFKNPEKNKI